MKKLMLTLLSLMITQSTYGMLNPNTDGFKCIVQGAHQECPGNNVVNLIIPSKSIEDGTLTGEINARKVNIITESGTELTVMMLLNISTDCLNINGQEYYTEQSFQEGQGVINQSIDPSTPNFILDFFNNRNK